jgi:hypothetical protein
MTKAAKGLTAKQVEELRQRLHGTCQNVFRVAEMMFNVKIGDEVFGQLMEQGIQKCSECNEWQETGNFEQGSEFCIACESIIDGEL